MGLRSSNPSEYWKILNKNTDCNKLPPISVKTLFEHYKDLNAGINVNDESDDVFNFNDVTYDDSFLNQPITSEEIKNCIKMLRTQKSPGDDLVINEYIINTVDLFIPVYGKLFYAILDTGIVSSDWLKGIIIPIY